MRVRVNVDCFNLSYGGKRLAAMPEGGRRRGRGLTCVNHGRTTRLRIEATGAANVGTPTSGGGSPGPGVGHRGELLGSGIHRLARWSQVAQPARSDAIR